MIKSITRVFTLTEKPKCLPELQYSSMLIASIMRKTGRTATVKCVARRQINNSTTDTFCRTGTRYRVNPGSAWSAVWWTTFITTKFLLSFLSQLQLVLASEQNRMWKLHVRLWITMSGANSSKFWTLTGQNKQQVSIARNHLICSSKL